MEAFRAAAARATRRDLDDPVALHRWSVDEPEEFWGLLFDTLVPGVHRPGPALRPGDDGPPSATWFPGVRMNVAEVILEGRVGERCPSPGDPMLVSVDERGRRSEVTRARARAEVGALAAALRAEGVGPGDRVAAWLPNTDVAMLVMLAAASIGAVFSSTSPDFGVDGVLDRFGQIEPTVLVAADGYTYGGRDFDRRAQLAEIMGGLPGLRRTVVLGFLDPAPDLSALEEFGSAVDYGAWVAPHLGTEPAFEQLPFDHPWYVLFSSGTTGVPKCIVHRTGGVLLQHVKEHQLHCDIGPGDRACYFTTCGWMMWNWLASVPASGATAVLYEGNPFHPGPQRLWELVDAESLSFLGISAKYVDAVAKAGYVPARSAGLASLRTIASTGSPLSPESFAWVYDSVAPGCGPDGLHLASISGGTDLCGCFVGGDPTRPVYSGEIQAPALGMDVDVWGPDGDPAPPGERGELVCTSPFPSTPLGFWGDGPLGEVGPRYRSAYFERFPGVWAHGDFASWTPHGGMVIHGRSDTTLNPGGVRIGTAEIYRQVEQLPAVLESLVFGEEVDGDVRIVLLVRLAEGQELTDGLVAEVRDRIRTGCTPRHVPAVVLAVDDLPRTRSGKLAELAVSDKVNGREVRNTSALANPESLDAIAALFD
jgi:acetoacetyl-CoA synthetase